MELVEVTDAGQIKKGDALALELDMEPAENIVLGAVAKEVIRPGTPKEEIVYQRRKNRYFITSMLLDGSSHISRAYIIRTSP